MSHLNSTQLISDMIFITINKTVMIPVNLAITVLGIANNAINIVIFTKLAAKDTMTISLTALAVSDFLFSCFTLPNFILGALISSGIEALYNVDLTSLLYVGFVWQRPLFHKISITITMFVSCERSLCVVKPFLIKRIFTRRRVILVIVGIFCSLTALFMPVYVNGGLIRKETFNGSAYLFVMNLGPDRATAEHIVHLLSGFSLVLITQVAIVIATVFMAIGLRRHQRFRQTGSTVKQDEQTKIANVDSQELNTKTQTAQKGRCPVSKTIISRTDSNILKQSENTNLRLKSATTSKEQSTIFPTTCQNQDSCTNEMSSQPTEMNCKDEPNQSVQTWATVSKAQNSSSKEHRLMKTVFTLAVMHVIFNSPVLVHYIFYYLEAEFRVNQRLGNLYLLSVDIAASLHCINGMVNIFVYLTLNRKFRRLFVKMFCCRSEKSK